MVLASRGELREAQRTYDARLEVDAGRAAVRALEESLDLSEKRHYRPCR